MGKETAATGASAAVAGFIISGAIALVSGAVKSGRTGAAGAVVRYGAAKLLPLGES